MIEDKLSNNPFTTN